MVSLALGNFYQVKLTDRGYWVSQCYKWMSLVYWSGYSLYFRTLTYFSVANPKIYLGGMLDERKSDIYSLVPSQYLPKTIMYPKPSVGILEDICVNFNFPIIVKPNVGFKGYMVKRIDSKEEFNTVIKEYADVELIVQEFLSEEHEYSVMYYFVDSSDFGVTSLVKKHLPNVVGNGKDTLKKLIERSKNPFINKSWVVEKNYLLLNKVLEVGQLYVLDHVGNYSRGSNFENLNSRIDPELTTTINEFYRMVNGMNFCRMDVKANSLEDLKKGNFKLLEINGAKSEPLHIYDPNLGFSHIVKSIHQHWTILFKVVKKSIKLMDFPSSIEGIKSYYSLKKMVS